MLLKLRQRMASERGFTLIELLVVMLIIGLLAAIAIPTFFNQREKARDAGAKEMAHTAQVAMETYATDNNGSYASVDPAALNTIDNSLNLAAGSPPKPYLSAASAPTANSWTLDITSPTGNVFTIARSSAGALTFTCTVPAGNNRAGCPTGGNWG
jgi:type IV pilus assembly protein PilA